MRREEELDEELQAHIEIEAKRLMDEGLSREEAMQQAIKSAEPSLAKRDWVRRSPPAARSARISGSPLCRVKSWATSVTGRGETRW